MGFNCLEQKFLGNVICDACGYETPIEEHTVDEAKKTLADLGWSEDKGHWVCPSCKATFEHTGFLLGYLDEYGHYVE